MLPGARNQRRPPCGHLAPTGTQPQVPCTQACLRTATALHNARRTRATNPAGVQQSRHSAAAKPSWHTGACCSRSMPSPPPTAADVSSGGVCECRRRLLAPCVTQWTMAMRGCVLATYCARLCALLAGVLVDIRVCAIWQAVCELLCSPLHLSYARGPHVYMLHPLNHSSASSHRMRRESLCVQPWTRLQRYHPRRVQMRPNA